MGAGEEIKKLRQQRGLTLREVIKASNGLLDKTTVSRIERDERGISLKAAYAFSKVFDVHMETLFELITGMKVPHSAIPFDTSQQERDFLKTYRVLAPKHRRSMNEIVRALAISGDVPSSDEARLEVVRELKKQRMKK